LFVSSFSSCGFHFSPFHGCSHFLLFIPGPRTSLKGPVPPTDCVVKFRDSLFSKYTASECHSRDLNECLKLNREAAIDGMDWLEKQMGQQRNRAKLDIKVNFAERVLNCTYSKDASREAIGSHGSKGLWRSNVLHSGRGRHAVCELEHIATLSHL
jgi:hypothetical protein